MSDLRFIFLAPSQEQLSTFLELRESGEILRRGRLPAAEALPLMRNIVIVPGTDVLARWIEAPAGTAVTSAVEAVLKNEIASPHEDTHTAIGIAGANGTVPVCVVDRTVMASYIEHAEALGISPDVIVPDHMTLPERDGDFVHAAIRHSRAVVRGRDLAFAMEPELAWHLVGSRPIRAVEGDVELILAKGAMHESINLLQQEFGKSLGKTLTFTSFRRAAILAAVLLFSPLALWTAEIAASHWTARILEMRAQHSARALPGASGSGDPIAYARARLVDVQGYDRFLLSTALLFDAVAQTSGVELDGYSYENGGVIRAVLVHAGADDIDAIAHAVQPAGVELLQEPATDRNGIPAVAVTLRPRP